MLSLPRLVSMQVSGKSNQYTLEVANSTPETDKDCIAWAQPHLNPSCHMEVQPPFRKTRWYDFGAKQ